jgi:hypothetical protein
MPEITLVQEIQNLYKWLDSQIKENIPSNSCSGCGQCCEYEKYGHRIYISNLELMYLKSFIPNLPPVTDGKCPFAKDNKCTVRDYRFGACRIFFCKADANFQQQLSEDFIKQIKILSDNHNLQYQYGNLDFMFLR